MFGHNEHHENNLPAPDDNLTDNGNATSAAPTDDNSSAYLDDVSPLGTSSPATSASDDNTDDTTTAASAAPATDTTAPQNADSTAPDTDKLLDIKQQALQQLTPLVGHLEQSPEEKFRTTMMMIQAADNHELIQAAYEAAQQITDEKVRAQALLDIVNEINYFTHNGAEAAA
jgi:hypothetical protein